MKSLQFFLQLTGLIVLFSGCTYNFGEPSLPTRIVLPPIEKIDVNKMKVEFATVRDFALVSCKSCHAGIQQPLLQGIENWRLHRAKVLEAIEGLNGAPKMPPEKDGFTPLTTCQIDLIKKWVELDCPESSDILVTTIQSCGGDLDNKPKNILEMPVNYQTLNQMILQPKCISCHNEKSSSDAAFQLLYPYKELASRRNLIGRDSSNSKFLRILKMSGEGRMPPELSDSGQPLDALTADELEFVKRLIDKGFPEN